MSNTKSVLKRLSIALGLTLGIAVVVSWYFFGWVVPRKRYFRNRDFRQLATLSSQIQQKVDNFDNVMDHGWDLIRDRNWTASCADYFTSLDFGLKYQEKSDLPQDIREMRGSDPPRLAIVRDEGEYRLFFAFAPAGAAGDSRCQQATVGAKPGTAKAKADAAETALYTRSSVESLIAPLALPLLESTFDGVLVSRRDGTVIFPEFNANGAATVASQQSLTNGILSLGGLEKAGGAGPVDIRTLDKAPMSTDVELEGARYTLYSQPIRLSYPTFERESETPEPGSAAPSEPSKAKKDIETAKGPAKGKQENESAETREASNAGSDEGSKAASNEVEEWIVCAMVRSDRFSRDSLAISLTTVLYFVLALFLILFLAPPAKMWLMRPKERLRSRDCVLLITSTFLGVALCSFAALDAYAYLFQFHEELKSQLSSVARSMQANLREEETRIWEQLDNFDSTKNQQLENDLAATGNPLGFAQESGGPGEDRQVRHCNNTTVDDESLEVCERTNILERGDVQPSIYPYLNIVFWDDDHGQGMQRIKWTYQRQVTPFVQESEQPYFGGIMKEAKWMQGSDAPVRGVQSLYSVNTGENLVIYWKLEPPGRLMNLDSSRGVLSASLMTRPVSLMGPVLPAGFRFAVLNKDGLVLFHSDPTRNRIENFFAETDNNDELRSLVTARASDFLNIYYAGRRQLLYVCPVQHSGLGGKVEDLKGESEWFLAVFTDMLPAETMNSEALTTSSILFIVYTLILLGCWVVCHLGWRGYPRKWFWPDPRRAKAYRLLILMNALLSALFLSLILQAAPGTVVAAGFLVPIFGLGLSFLLVKWSGGEASRTGGPLVRAWQRLIAAVGLSRRPDLEVSHLGARVSLLVVIAVLPCVAFFRVSFEFERMLLVNRDQQGLINSLKVRQERIRTAYQSIALSDSSRRILLDRSDLPPMNASDKGEKKALDHQDQGPVATRQCPLWLALGDFEFCPPASSPAPEGGEVNAYKEAAARNRDWVMEPVAWRASTSARGSVVRTRRFRCGGITTTITQHDPAPDVAGEAQTAPSPEYFAENLQRLLAKGRPLYTDIAGQTEALVKERNPAAGDRWTCRRRSDGTPKLELTCQTHDGSLLVTTDWLSLDFGRANWRAWFGLAPLVFVAYLFVRLGEKIFVPGLYRSVPALDPAFLSAMEEFKRKFSGMDEKKRGEMVCFLLDEFGPTPELQKVGTQFVSNLEAEISPDKLDSKIQTAVVEYYRQLWDTLSKDEKLVLAQLAHEEGLVNPNNRMLVAQLMNKGIILRDPHFKLMNSSFAHFVLAAVSPEIMNEWERAGLRLPWRAIRFVLLGAVVIVGIFLYVSQQALFEGLIGYVGAIAAAIAGLLNLFGIFRGTPSAENLAK